MFLKKRKVQGTYYYSLVESYREKAKVKQKTVLSLGNYETAYQRLKERQEYAQFFEQLRCGQKIRYHTLLLDPPWQERGGGKIKRGADKHYPLMSLEEIKALPINELAYDDCHLYLWVTNNFLQGGLECIEAWGFRYITMITWVKDRIGLGQYHRGQTEHCLFAVKGNLPYKLLQDGTRLQGQTFIHARRRRHSQKPDEIFEIIEKVSWEPYLELFARKRHSRKWDVWGNEVNSDIEL
ncbi:MT-A70 family methyltransferase [Bacillus sp. FJAT-28004]|uniref:MT-A70 family methyltransferase n=1 Tax=Bacillus sp. FJAT-28004 TaxID=1679165 RepID=UPI0009EBC89A|nr:MT-A70 family methyltransferase [Bacillus sp. FJAT-28004]